MDKLIDARNKRFPNGESIPDTFFVSEYDEPIIGRDFDDYRKSDWEYIEPQALEDLTGNDVRCEGFIHGRSETEHLFYRAKVAKGVIFNSIGTVGSLIGIGNTDNNYVLAALGFSAAVFAANLIRYGLKDGEITKKW